MITDHAYDCGPMNTGDPCIVQTGSDEAFVAGPCGKLEHEHQYSEYDTTASRYEEPPGDMHEPPAYRGELNWLNHQHDHEDWDPEAGLSPFVD